MTDGVARLQKSAMMSQVVTHGGVAYLSGQIAWDSRAGSVGEQTREILGRIDALLAEADTEKSALLTASIWLADITEFEAMNEVWIAWVDPDNPPVRATVEARLAFPDLKVEIQVTAALKAG